MNSLASVFRERGPARVHEYSSKKETLGVVRTVMRIAFDTPETDSEQRRSSTPKEEIEWVPLQKHPVFAATSASIDGDSGAAVSRNLVAWDGASRLYFWDPKTNCLHRLSLRLGEPDPSSVLAASPSKVLPPSGCGCHLGCRFSFRCLGKCLSCKPVSLN